MRDHTRWPHNGDGKMNSLGGTITGAHTITDGIGHLHAVGETHHHDQRRHDVEKQIELEAGPAEQAQRQQHRQHRRQCCQQHQPERAEEQQRDARTEQQPQSVVDHLIALDRIANFELHDRRAR